MSLSVAILRVIRSQLTLRGLTVAQMAASQGVSRQAVNQQINGCGRSIESLEAVCGRLGVSVSYVIQCAEEFASANPQEKTSGQETEA